MERDGQFHDAEVGGQMPTGLRNAVDQERAEFVGQLG
jgi:hypothetical protein